MQYACCSDTMDEARLELHRTMQYQDNINIPLLVQILQLYLYLYLLSTNTKTTSTFLC